MVTYHLKESVRSLREARRERERAQAAAGEPLPYPTWDELRAEDRAEDPAVFVVIRDTDGSVVRRIEAPKAAGIHRVAWDLRYPDAAGGERGGPLAMPAAYTAELVRRDENGTTRIGEPQSFTPNVLARAGVPEVDVEARHAFQREVATLQRQVFGAVSALEASIERVEALAEAIYESGASDELRSQASAIRAGLLELRVRFLGDDSVRSRFEAVLPGIRQRIQRVVRAFWSMADPTTTHRRQVEIVREEFGPANAELVNLVEVQLAGLEAQADAAGVPWTPGRRIPR